MKVIRRNKELAVFDSPFLSQYDQLKEDYDPDKLSELPDDFEKTTSPE